MHAVGGEDVPLPSQSREVAAEDGVDCSCSSATRGVEVAHQRRVDVDHVAPIGVHEPDEAVRPRGDLVAQVGEGTRRFLERGSAEARFLGQVGRPVFKDAPIAGDSQVLAERLEQVELIARVFDGETEGLTRDDVLDNMTIAWLTNTTLSGARLY